MEKESFEDDDVAALMNDTFVKHQSWQGRKGPILIAFIWQFARQWQEAGAWPLNLLLTPDRETISRYDLYTERKQVRPGWYAGHDTQVKELWKSHRDEVEKAANHNVNALKPVSESPAEKDWLKR